MNEQQEKEYQERKDAFNKTVEQCVQEGDIKALAIKYADTLSDMEYMKSLNEDIATRYAEMLECFPVLAEMNTLIYSLEQDLNNCNNEEDKKFRADRIKKLQKFRSAIIELEKQNINHTPENYSLPKESDQ